MPSGEQWRREAQDAINAAKKKLRAQKGRYRVRDPYANAQPVTYRPAPQPEEDDDDV